VISSCGNGHGMLTFTARYFNELKLHNTTATMFSIWGINMSHFLNSPVERFQFIVADTSVNNQEKLFERGKVKIVELLYALYCWAMMHVCINALIAIIVFSWFLINHICALDFIWLKIRCLPYKCCMFSFSLTFLWQRFRSID
jgi:hypothetical protein